jgi:hypothetical protein
MAVGRLPETGADLCSQPIIAAPSAAIRQRSCGLRWKAGGGGWRTCPPPPRSSA